MTPRKAFLKLLGSAVLLSCGGNSGDDLVDPNAPELSCSIPQEQIFDGGVGRDGIPALNQPNLGGAQAGFMDGDDRVLGMVVNGEARAYPMGILWWHEIVNDTLGGTPILVTYCPLTGSGIAFDPTVDGAVRQFGVSGLLYRSNLTMFDRETNSLWNQMLLGSQCGLERGKTLSRLPITETTWAQWVSAHPTTTVVSVDQGDDFVSYFLYPYGSYDDPNNGTVNFLGAGVRFSNERPPKELVLGVFDGDEAKAFPFGLMARGADVDVVNDQVADSPILVTYEETHELAKAFDRRVDGEVLTFQLNTNLPFTLIDDQTSSIWDGDGLATSGPKEGTRLERYADAYVAFWFAWSLYYPDIEIFN